MEIHTCRPLCDICQRVLQLWWRGVGGVTFGLGGGAVRVAQRQQSHLDELVEQHVLAHQDELGVLLLAVEVHGVLVVLHHAEHRQHVACRHGNTRVLGVRTLSVSRSQGVIFSPMIELGEEK